MSADTSSSQPAAKSSIAPPKEDLLPIGGITEFTTIDFPGRLAAVLYTQGCSWRCEYCYNGHLQPFKKRGSIGWSDVLLFLETRRGLLDGVVFCGGEPTSHAGLPQAMQSVKEWGFEVALHTTGMFPERLKEVLGLCDWVGMDIKAPFDRYEVVTQIPESGEKPQESAAILLKSGVDYEFRTTVHPDLLSEKDLLNIGKQLSALGAKNFALQTFQPEGCQNPKLAQKLISSNLISKQLSHTLNTLFASFQIR